MENGSKKVLIVDDNRLIRRIMRDAIEMEGHICLEAGGVKDAFHMARKENIDICFLDFHLGDGTGIDFIRMLKADATIEQPVVYFVTGSDTGELAEKAEYLGASGVLYKPVEPETLISKIRSL